MQGSDEFLLSQLFIMVLVQALEDVRTIQFLHCDMLFEAEQIVRTSVPLGQRFGQLPFRHDPVSVLVQRLEQPLRLGVELGLR